MTAVALEVVVGIHREPTLTTNHSKQDLTTTVCTEMLRDKIITLQL